VWLDPLHIFGDTRYEAAFQLIKRSCNEHISMPPQESTEKVAEEQSSFSRSTSKVRDFFSIPAPVKQLFDLVPVVTYPPNQLPLRAPKSARIPSLYVFSKDQDAAAGRPSFNPSCLKWQVGMATTPIWSQTNSTRPS
jgi:hypothetical protein